VVRIFNYEFSDFVPPPPPKFSSFGNSKHVETTCSDGGSRSREVHSSQGS
jgi:hypothetical protein